MELNTQLLFNEDCENPIIELTGLEDIQASELVTKISILYTKNACDKGCKTDRVDTQFDIIAGEEPILPEGWSLEGDSLLMPSVAGINKVKIKVYYTEDESPNIISESHCQFNDCDIYCQLVSYLENNDYSFELYGYIEAIKFAIECGNCCVACKLYDFLVKKLTNKNCLDCE
jgi:hypothetical protein